MQWQCTAYYIYAPTQALRNAANCNAETAEPGEPVR